MFGFHYFPDDTHYRTADLKTWLPELQAVGARWLTLMGSATRAVPEAFVRPLIEAGITPIIHIPALAPRDSAVVMEPLFKTYARWGVRYVAVFSEPNTRTVWPATEWGKTALLERFLDLLIPVWQGQSAAGLQPVFPALKAGGDYWDTAFLEGALAGLERRGQMDLARQLTFAVNLWTFNRPINWGVGGARRWPEARPYSTPPGSQDQRGFHVFEWYAEIIRARLGEARPLLCLAGGPRLNDHTDTSFPVLDETRHASCIEELTQAALQQQWPPELLNVNFWLLTAPENSPLASEAWYRPNGENLPALESLKRWASAQSAPPQKKVTAKTTAAQKPLRHYVLLPTFEWGISEWHWNAVLHYLQTTRPACGFSVDEAQHAEQVTIIGNEQGIGREAEQQLRAAGCTVQRLLVKDGQVSPSFVEESKTPWTPRSRL